MTTLSYTRNGDYLLPDITLRNQTPEPLTKYGLMRRTFLKQHKPMLYNQLVLSEQLYPHQSKRRMDKSPRPRTNAGIGADSRKALSDVVY